MTTSEAIEVGAFTWARIQRQYDADPTVHWQRCEAEGLELPTLVGHTVANVRP